MNHFHRRHGTLCAENIDLEHIAVQFGTPTYVYSQSTITRHVQVFRKALESINHLLCYAVKANANQAILELMQSLGCGFDAVSGGELARVLKAGGSMGSTIFSGVGKTDIEIAQALRARVRYICAESQEELSAIDRVAALNKVKAPVTLRINPDVDAHTHPNISTGMKENKFGIPMNKVEQIVQQVQRDKHIQLVGISCHIGSQITQLEPFLDAAHRIEKLARRLLAQGVELKYIGMGGGLGIPYSAQQELPDPAEYGSALAQILKPLDLTLVLEPGRVLVGNAGVLLTRVVRTKQQDGKQFVILDAGMNDLMRPALYDAHHEIEPVSSDVFDRGPKELVDVVGPVCETTDTFARNEKLPPLVAGDLLAIRSTGAYGFVMASTYNGRPRAAEVLCYQSDKQLIRQRERVSQLWQGEYHLSGSLVDDHLPFGTELSP